MKGSIAKGLEVRLRTVGLKVTQSRIALLRALVTGHGPFSPEELHAQLANTRCDLVTIYRGLSAFEEKGLVRRCYFGDGRTRFELHHETEHHHHLVCKECRGVFPVAECALEVAESSLRNQGFAHVSHSLEFFGLCPKCVRLN